MMGGSSVGWVTKFLDGVQQNWAGQCEIVGGVGLSCRGTICNGQWSLLIPAGDLGVLRAPQQVQGRTLVGVQVAMPLEAPGILHVLVAENGLNIRRSCSLPYYKRDQNCISNAICHFSLFYNCLVKKKTE